MQITFNGKTYNNIEDMPAKERAAFNQMQQIFVDANGNGIPDFMEGDMFKNVMAAASNNVVYEGKVYNNLEDIPPDVREKVQTALNKLKQLGLVADVPDMRASASNARPDFEPAFPASKPLIPQEPTFDDGGRNLVLIISSLVALLVCGAGIAAAFFLMR